MKLRRLIANPNSVGLGERSALSVMLISPSDLRCPTG
jgi:hypothetical protein